MASGSFGPRYRDIGGDHADALLRYLDDVAEVSLVRQVKAEATAALALRPGDRVIELGCGTGVDLPALAAAVGPTGAVVGCDPSREALAAARRRLEGVELVAARAEDLPFADDAFDACRLDRTLQHVPDPEVALEEVARVVRAGGRLVVLEIGAELEVGGVDAELTRAVAKRLWPPDDQAWVGLLLPVLLRRTGWEHLDLRQETVVSRALDDADAILRLRPAQAEAVADGQVDAETARRWRDAVEAAAGAGALELRLHCFRIAAVRS